MNQVRDDLPSDEEPLFNIGAVSRMTDNYTRLCRVWDTARADVTEEVA